MRPVDQTGWAARKQRFTLPDGRSLGYIDSGGDGPVLLLLHGFTDNSRSYSLIEPWLQGYRLVMPDLPGHGATDAGAVLGIDSFAADVVALVRALDLRQLAVIGHSMGAMTGITVAARLRLEVTALVTICGSLRPALPQDGLIERAIRGLSDPVDPADPFFDEWHFCSHPVPADFLGALRREAAAIRVRVWHGILDRLDHTDLSADAAAVAAPVLCIAGSDDPLFGSDHRAVLAAGFAQAQAVVLEGYGHNPHWEDPQRVAGLIRAFLSPE